MSKKLTSFYLALMLFFNTLNSFAETCPNVESLKQDRLAGWKFYDSEDGKPLSAKQIKEYKAMVYKFVLAEWQKNPPSIHCYYSDQNGSGFEAYIAKINLIPQYLKHWYPVTGAVHCIAGMERCHFGQEKTNHLAANRSAV